MCMKNSTYIYIYVSDAEIFNPLGFSGNGETKDGDEANLSRCAWNNVGCATHCFILLRFLIVTHSVRYWEPWFLRDATGLEQ